MKTLRYWHNPRCSKSREGLALLAARGITPDLLLYLADPPSPAAILALMAKLGGDPRQMVRFKEDEAATLGLSPQDQRPAAEWAALLAQNPRLIERPVLESPDRAVIGRPTEALLALL